MFHPEIHPSPKNMLHERCDVEFDWQRLGDANVPGIRNLSQVTFGFPGVFYLFLQRQKARWDDMTNDNFVKSGLIFGKQKWIRHVTLIHQILSFARSAFFSIQSVHLLWFQCHPPPHAQINIPKNWFESGGPKDFAEPSATSLRPHVCHQGQFPYPFPTDWGGPIWKYIGKLGNILQTGMND